MANHIDGDIRKFVNNAYTKTRDSLQTHEEALHAVAAALLERETISGAELQDICSAHGVILPSQQQ